MAIKFSEKFGLEADRKKLVVGVGKFDIIRIEIKESKKEYKTQDGEGKIKIAHFDTIMKADGSIAKYYSPNKAIIQACEGILDAVGTKDKNGTLKEVVFIDEVVESGEKGREYLYFK